MQSEDSVDPTKVAATVATSTATSVAADANSSEDSLQDDASAAAEVAANQPGAIRVIRRNGKVTLFGKDKISVAVTKAFLAVEGGTGAASARIREHVATITERVVNAVTRNLTSGGTIHIEDIQDHVELALMRSGHHKVAREYVLYREEQSRKRREQAVSAQVSSVEPEPAIAISVVLPDGSRQVLDEGRLRTLASEAAEGLEGLDSNLVFNETVRNLFDGVALVDVNATLVMSARTLIEKEPNYSYMAARLLCDSLRTEALTYLDLKANQATQREMEVMYGEAFQAYIGKGVELELLDSELLNYDLDQLGAALKGERDQQFTYLGLQTLYDRYFIHTDGVRIELPQVFFMRVAMGLAINEEDRESRAIEFYNLLSSFDFMSSTPTLFNSGTLRPQLSSCYLTSVPDNLDGIYGSLRDNALLSKFAGGLGNDWTRVRAMGAYIKGTNGKSQGVVPFLKVANDTAVAVNQGGKRKGAVCAYLETWHLDVEEFLDLRKNTGDDRRRTHDMNTANWVPDLFMKRVAENGTWTLFSPDDVTDLHDLYGLEFEQAYAAYEAQTLNGEIKNFRTLPAVDLWRKMLGMIYETGHPWMTFKDPCNLRSPQRHAGVVHSSNLCTEITLNTSDAEIAVCNLGSVNLPQHMTEDGQVDHGKLEATITTAMRMLDNVIEYNYYSVPQARNSNLRHRPVGLGVMGFQDSLYIKRLAYGTQEAIQLADEYQEAISYYAIQASCQLAEERGTYESYEGSLWSQGIMPIDSISYLKESRGKYLDQDTSSTMDWDSLRSAVKEHGMRNSNTMAIAPTATISNICGVSQSIEPTYQNLFVKSNLSGEFTVVNPYMVRDLKKLDLWDEVMVNDLKYFDGSLQPIDRIPPEIKGLYSTAFELDARWLIEAGSRRQKWIDQAQSLNLYMAEPDGKKLDNLYKLAWIKGLKTTYYLRTMGATHVEKSTMADTGRSNSLNAVGGSQEEQSVGSEAPQACSILDPECEACQ